MFGSDSGKDTRIMLGDPKTAIYATVIPFIISSIIGQINMLADLAWCSGLGASSVNAVQSVVPLYWVVFDVGLGVGLGSNVLISNYIGAGNYDRARKILAQGTVLSVIIAVLIAPFTFLLIDPMVTWMGAPELIGAAESYLAPILICNIFQVLGPTLSGFLRGEGAAKKSNYCIIIGTLANIVIDPIFIFGLDLGVAGAGAATALSGAVSVILMLYIYLSGKTTIKLSLKGYRFDRKESFAILRLGIPKMAEMFLLDIADAFCRSFFIACGGVNAISLFSIPYRVVLLASLVPGAFGLALTPVSSANLGAGKPEKSLYAYNLCLKWTLGLTAILVLIYLTCTEYLLIPFTLSDSMTELSPEMIETLRVQSFIIPFLAISLVSNSMLQSLQKPMLSLSVTAFRTLLMVVLLAALSTTTVPLMCWGLVLSLAFTACYSFMLARYNVGKIIKSSGNPARSVIFK